VQWAVRTRPPPFEAEHWKYGYLVDAIFLATRGYRLDTYARPAVDEPDPNTTAPIAGIFAEWTTSQQTHRAFTAVLRRIL
jgi:hypothetical protein